MNKAERVTDRIGRSPGNRAGLSLARIVDAARTLPPAELSMQAVATRLGVDPKALNHHVTDRATLLGIVAEAEFADRFAGVEISNHADWKEACRAFGVGFTKAVMLTGAYAQHLSPHRAMEARFLDMNEAVLAKLVEAGFDDETAVRSLVLLTSVCYAHVRDMDAAQDEASRRRTLLVQSLSQYDANAYPNLARIARNGLDTYNDAQLRFSIDACLAGLVHRLDCRDARP